jgi:hypothetical protein
MGQQRDGRLTGLSSFTNRCVPAAAGAALAVAAVLVPGRARADAIGLDVLRSTDPTLTGSGVFVAQVEAGGPPSAPPNFEVNPSAVGQPSLPFTFTSTNGTSTVFPNSVGTESGHADTVAAQFYGSSTGVAPGVAHVDNLEADYFFNNVIATGATASVTASVINQSFAFTDTNGNLVQDPQVDQAYDNFVYNSGTGSGAQRVMTRIFVSATGNSGKPASPSTMYNGIAVGSFNGATATGPTTDGRSKPDLVAPASETSYAAPQVSGAAAILVQAAARGDAGAANATVAQDFRVVKALLLNGATKPDGWVHTQTAPLDPRYGAGVLNVYNAYQQLHAGRQTFNTTTTVTRGGAHPPASGVSANEPSNVGWAFDTLTSGLNSDVVGHYFFNVTGASGLTATLDWERAAGGTIGGTTLQLTTPNNLDLFLYDANTGALVDQSISTVDNVEHLYDPNLPAGRYDLEVLLHGALATPVSQTYGLAYNFAAVPEPATGLIVLAGGTALLARRRRRRQA